uniref:Uncharacterized protein n=1 Tax=Knipowitschia caucasica TaxID=637954 RepID=A0AAV2LQH7_KNICA
MRKSTTRARVHGRQSKVPIFSVRGSIPAGPDARLGVGGCCAVALVSSHNYDGPKVTPATRSSSLSFLRADPLRNTTLSHPTR